MSRDSPAREAREAVLAVLPVLAADTQEVSGLARPEAARSSSPGGVVYDFFCFF